MNYLKLGLLALFASVGVFATQAHAHAFLDHAVPAVGATLNTSPAQIQIWFTEDIDQTGTKIQVFNAKGVEVDRHDSHPDSKNHLLETVSLNRLPAGQYHVTWKALCLAGHTTGGSYDFTVLK